MATYIPPITLSKYDKKVRFDFSLECLEKLIRQMQTRQLIFSPYILHKTLMMVYFASSGNTEKQLRNILHLSEDYEKAKWISYYSNKIREMNENEYYDQTICWIHKNKNLKDVISTLFPNKCLRLDPSTSSLRVYREKLNTILMTQMQDCSNQSINFKNLTTNIEFILLSVLCFRGRLQRSIPPNIQERILIEGPRTVVCPVLDMFITELPLLNKPQSLYMLFPAKKLSSESNIWKINEDISGLVERLTSTFGINCLRQVLDENTSLIEKTIEGILICPDMFIVEKQLPIRILLDHLNITTTLEHDEAKLNDFTDENLLLGHYVHRAYIKMAKGNVIAGVMNMFLTRDETTRFEKFNTLFDETLPKYSFVWLIYDRLNSIILFIGVIRKSPQLHSSNITLRTCS